MLTNLAMKGHDPGTQAVLGLAHDPAIQVRNGRLPRADELRDGFLRKPRGHQVADLLCEIHHASQYIVNTLNRNDVIQTADNDGSTTTHEHMKNRSVGERLREARKRRGLTQAALAKLAGCTQSALSDLECGRNANSRDIPVLAAVLGVASLWLSTGEGPMNESADVVRGVQPARQINTALLLNCLRAAELYVRKAGSNLTDDETLQLACRLYEQQIDYPTKSPQELAQYLLNITAVLKFDD